MLELLFIDIVTGDVKYVVVDVSLVRYITPSEISFTVNGRNRSCSFPHTERLEVTHKTDSPIRAALLRSIPHA